MPANLDQNGLSISLMGGWPLEIAEAHGVEEFRFYVHGYHQLQTGLFFIRCNHAGMGWKYSLRSIDILHLYGWHQSSTELHLLKNNSNFQFYLQHNIHILCLAIEQVISRKASNILIPHDCPRLPKTKQVLDIIWIQKKDDAFFFLRKT